MKYQHWSLEEDTQHILWVSLEVADSAVNTLSFAVLKELTVIVEDLKINTSYRGVVFISNKSSGFIAGADVKEIAAVEDANAAVSHMRQVQTVFSEIEALPIPTVVAIHGFCLGGGTELALACHYRIATDDRQTTMALPEVKLGIHPGFGGSVRAVRLLGAIRGLPFVLEGRSVDAITAKRMGLLDEVVPLRELRRAAVYFIQHKPKIRSMSFVSKILEISFVRHLLGSMIKKKLAAKVNSEQYPAPYAVVDNWINVGSLEGKAFATEAESVGRLLKTTTCRNLLYVFSLQEKLKSVGKEMDFKVQHIHVVGAGVMGGDIAAWCAVQGIKVTLQDPSTKALGSTVARTYELAKKHLKQTYLVQAALDRLCPDPEGDGIAQADLIIEAAVENLELKHEVFKKIEANARADAVLATNTSSLSLTEIGRALTQPQRLVGIHFFNPVSRMPLVEVVHSKHTDRMIAAYAAAFVKQIKKLPLLVEDAPGFLVNQIIGGYFTEAFKALAAGDSMSAIDAAGRRLGMPMGPLELCDQVGLDVCLAVSSHLMGAEAEAAQTLLRTKIDKGELGRKTQKGFYDYVNGKMVPLKEALDPQKIIALERQLFLGLFNRALLCLDEAIVNNLELVDAGSVFGLGFAPYQGGLLHYARTMNQSDLAKELAVYRNVGVQAIESSSAWQLLW